LYETIVLYLENINQYGIKDNAVQRIKYSKVSGQINFFKLLNIS